MLNFSLPRSLVWLILASACLTPGGLRRATPISHRPGPVRHLAADFDGDGLQDLVRVGHRHVTLHFSNGQGIVRLRTLPHTLGIAAADIDRDGDVDLLALSLHGSLRLWKNEGSRGFSSWTRPPPQAAPIDTVSSYTQLHPDLPWGPLAASIPNAPAVRPGYPSAPFPITAASSAVHLLHQSHPPSVAVIGDCPRPPPAA